MRRLVLSISLLLGAACTPGSGEFGTCVSTPDCQVNLQCKPAIVSGEPITDGGVCRYACGESANTCSDHGEICGVNGLCSSDGGY